MRMNRKQFGSDFLAGWLKCLQDIPGKNIILISMNAYAHIIEIRKSHQDKEIK